MLEPGNIHDRNAVAIEKDGKSSAIYHGRYHVSVLFFLKRGGTIRCTVTGGRIFSADLPQGGLEIPCTVVFVGQRKEVQKLKRVIKHIGL